MDLGDVFKSDQDNEAISRFGAMFGVYYKGLLQSGIPADLAQQMTLDYHWLLTCSYQFKNGAYPPRS